MNFKKLSAFLLAAVILFNLRHAAKTIIRPKMKKTMQAVRIRYQTVKIILILASILIMPPSAIPVTRILISEMIST